MAERLFISQVKLETWIEEGKVTFEDNLLTLLAEKVAYRLEPAARISSVLDGQDTRALVGKALTVAELTAMGVEHYHDSAIAGDTAYQCEEGFMGTAQAAIPLAEAPVVTPAPPVPAPPAAIPAPADEESAADLLAAFMLKHM